MISAISSALRSAGVSLTSVASGSLGTPLTRGGLVAAVIKATVGGAPVEIPCHFNPSELTVKKDASWTPETQLGFNMPKMTFGSGQPKSLSLSLIFDSADTLKQENIRKTTDKLWKFILVDPSLKDATSGKSRPPKVTFTWEQFEFKGAVTSMSHSYILFNELGVPLRAKVSITLQEIEDEVVAAVTTNMAATALRAANTAAALASGMVGTALALSSAAAASSSSNSSSSAKPKTSSSSSAPVVTQEGTRIDHVAAATTGDSANQRQVAENNNIDNPMKLPKGQVIS